MCFQVSEQKTIFHCVSDSILTPRYVNVNTRFDKLSQEVTVKRTKSLGAAGYIFWCHSVQLNFNIKENYNFLTQSRMQWSKHIKLISIMGYQGQRFFFL